MIESVITTLTTRLDTETQQRRAMEEAAMCHTVDSDCGVDSSEHDYVVCHSIKRLHVASLQHLVML